MYRVRVHKVAAAREKTKKRPAQRPICANHLLKEGWLPFLSKLDGPDILLWHQIATDFNDMAGDRLHAAYWILEQPDCDRATARDFIIGMIVYDALSYDIARDRKEPSLQVPKRAQFEAVLKRWEDGFYPHHSIASKDHSSQVIQTLQEDADTITTRLKAARLVLPAGLDISLQNPTDDFSRSQSHGLTYSYDEGLQLIEGRDWHNPDWAPKSAA